MKCLAGFESLNREVRVSGREYSSGNTCGYCLIISNFLPPIMAAVSEKVLLNEP